VQACKRLDHGRAFIRTRKDLKVPNSGLTRAAAVTEGNREIPKIHGDTGRPTPRSATACHCSAQHSNASAIVDPEPGRWRRCRRLLSGAVTVGADELELVAVGPITVLYENTCTSREQRQASASPSRVSSPVGRQDGSMRGRGRSPTCRAKRGWRAAAWGGWVLW
jgi:hypothetical protein